MQPPTKRVEALAAAGLITAAADKAAAAAAAEGAATVRAASISLAEARVLRYLPTQLTFAMTADKLGISRSAAKERAERAHKKLSVHSRRRPSAGPEPSASSTDPRSGPAAPVPLPAVPARLCTSHPLIIRVVLLPAVLVLLGTRPWPVLMPPPAGVRARRCRCRRGLLEAGYYRVRGRRG
jgi:DNA-binding CsgD family transcriptional regulator